MIKAILFDIDGVIIRHQNYFWETLSSENYSNPIITMSRLYKSDDNRKCDKGELDILDYIKPFLEKINWDKLAEDYLNLQYQYEYQFIDFELLSKINTIKSIGVKTFIASNQNHYRKKNLINMMDVDNVFSDYYFSCDIGYVKSENEYWDKVLKNINAKHGNIRNEEILFIDDMDKNTRKAEEFNLQTCLISCKNDIEEIIRKIEEGSGLTIAST